MKAIIASVIGVFVAVMGIAAPAGATASNGGGFYLAGNGSAHHSGWSRMGVKDGKFYIEGESIFCHTSNVVMGGKMVTGSAQVNTTTPTLPPADNPCGGGNAGEVINNPPANSTVTINGICGDPAEIAKIKAANANLIINSTGPCPANPTTPAPQPTIIVHVNAPAPAAEVKTASATTSTPAAATTADPKGGAGVAELPQTGVNEVITAIIATVLAAGTYAGVMAVRAYRARA